MAIQVAGRVAVLAQESAMCDGHAAIMSTAHRQTCIPKLPSRVFGTQACSHEQTRQLSNGSQTRPSKTNFTNAPQHKETKITQAALPWNIQQQTQNSTDTAAARSQQDSGDATADRLQLENVTSNAVQRHSRHNLGKTKCRSWHVQHVTSSTASRSSQMAQSNISVADKPLHTRVQPLCFVLLNHA